MVKTIFPSKKDEDILKFLRKTFRKQKLNANKFLIDVFGDSRSFRGINLQKYMFKPSDLVKKIKKFAKQEGKALKPKSLSRIKRGINALFSNRINKLLPKVKTKRERKKEYWRVSINKTIKELTRIIRGSVPQFYVLAKEKKSKKVVAYPLRKETKLLKEKYEDVRVVLIEEAQYDELRIRRKKYSKPKPKKIQVKAKSKYISDIQQALKGLYKLQSISENEMKQYENISNMINEDFFKKLRMYLASNPSLRQKLFEKLKEEFPNADDERIKNMLNKLERNEVLELLVEEGILIKIIPKISYYHYYTHLGFNREYRSVVRSEESENYFQGVSAEFYDYYFQGETRYTREFYIAKTILEAKFLETHYEIQSNVENITITTLNEGLFKEALTILKGFPEGTIRSGDDVANVNVYYIDEITF